MSSLTLSPERSPIFIPGIPTPDYDSTPDRSPSNRREDGWLSMSSLLYPFLNFQGHLGFFAKTFAKTVLLNLILMLVFL